MKQELFSSEVLLITPQIAKDILDRNTMNRPIKRVLVGKYAYLMRTGAWDNTGEAIIISDDNQLLNGQHRLLACIEAGTSFFCTIVRGVKKECFRSIDVGKRRTFSDLLAINDKIRNNCVFNEQESSDFAGAVRNILYFRQLIATGSESKLRHGFSDEQLFSVWEEKREVLVFARKVVVGKQGAAKKRDTALIRVPTSFLLALYVLFSEKDEALAKEYMQDLCNINNRFPASVFVKQDINKLKTVNMDSGSFVDSFRMRASIRIIHGWNCLRLNRTVTTLCGFTQNMLGRKKQFQWKDCIV